MASYSDWLNQQIQNKKVENTPSNAVSFKDYLSQNAIDPTSQYNTQVASANQTYQRSLATYGQNAEALAQNGLTNSGYASYLSGNAYATRANTINQAQQQASDTLNTASQGYASYLTNLKAQNQQSESEAYNALVNAVSNGQSANSALIGLQGSYDQSVLDTVKNRYWQSQAQQIKDTIGTTSDMNNYMDSIDNLITLGMDESTASQLKADAYGKNEAILQNQIDTGNFETAQWYKALADVKDDGTVKKTSEEEWSKMDKDEQEAYVVDYVNNLYNEGLISKEYYQDYYKKMFESSSKDTVIRAENIIDNANTAYEDGKISVETYNEIKANAQKAIDSKQGIDFGESVASYDKVEVSYYQQGKGKETINLTAKGKEIEDTSSFVAVKEITTKDNYISSTKSKATLGFVNGELAYKIGDRVYIAKYANTKDNNDFVARMKKLGGGN